MPDNPNPRHQYQEFILTAIEAYKNAIAREDLLEIGDEAVRHLATEQQHLLLSEVLLLEEVDRIVARRLQLPSFAEWRRTRGLEVTRTPLLLGPDGRELTSKQVRRPLITVAGVSEGLLRVLREDPKNLHALTPRQFEELVAELLARQGFECELTPASMDGGKDVIARLNTAAGTFVFYVECKKYGPDQRVGVRLVRELLGVVSQGRVTAGLMVTTSSFTRPALEVERAAPHRLSLRDYNHVVEWLWHVGPQPRRRPDTP